ncbi:MAG TPA: metal-dependent transcriptional regulator [Anaerolineales bacterium]|nr:metal-dependent transcriptional regulator [Anaerolineales bacterium]
MSDPLIALLIGVAGLALFSLLFWPKGGLIGHLQRVSKLDQRVQQEDALKFIHKAERSGKPVTPESLAETLKTNSARAENLLNEMEQNELLIAAQGEFKLTTTGQQYALRVIRAHRLWERYLAEETGYDEAKWHDLADRYEHQLTTEQINALSTQLGNPTHDPHGDPIPAEDGKFVAHGGKPLTEMPLEDRLQIVHMEDEPEAVYAQLVAEGLHPGMQVQITEKTQQRIRFWANGEEHVLAPIVADSISVVPLPEPSQELACAGRPLHALKPGQSGTVASLSPRLRGAERRRMMDLGILPGTVIHAEISSPAGDPTAYRIRGALIALRREQADLICIQTIQEAA